MARRQAEVDGQRATMDGARRAAAAVSEDLF